MFHKGIVNEYCVRLLNGGLCLCLACQALKSEVGQSEHLTEEAHYVLVAEQAAPLSGVADAGYLPKSDSIEAARCYIYSQQMRPGREDYFSLFSNDFGSVDLITVTPKPCLDGAHKAGQWGACVDIAEALVMTAPDVSLGWLHRSCALHELKRTQEAYEFLEAAADL